MSQHSPSTPSPRDNTELDPALSHCSVALLSAHSLAVWAPPQTQVGTGTIPTMCDDTVPRPYSELALGLAPGKLVVVGRAQPEHTVPYLDPAYRSTTMVPNTNQPVLHGSDPTDNYVSRAHFTLRGAPGGGIVFTNGVPSVDGGVRPPTNGTWLVAPARRFLDPGEEVPIDFGQTVVIWLPNGCTLQLRAQ